MYRGIMPFEAPRIVKRVRAIPHSLNALSVQASPYDDSNADKVIPLRACAVFFRKSLSESMYLSSDDPVSYRPHVWEA